MKGYTPDSSFWGGLLFAQGPIWLVYNYWPFCLSFGTMLAVPFMGHVTAWLKCKNFPFKNGSVVNINPLNMQNWTLAILSSVSSSPSYIKERWNDMISVRCSWLLWPFIRWLFSRLSFDSSVYVSVLTLPPALPKYMLPEVWPLAFCVLRAQPPSGSQPHSIQGQTRSWSETANCFTAKTWGKCQRRRQPLPVKLFGPLTRKRGAMARKMAELIGFG